MAGEVKTQVDIMLEGKPLQGTPLAKQEALHALCERVGQDAGQVVRAALLMRAAADRKYRLPRAATLSLVLCDDARIAQLNAQTRGKEGPTDVLSFEMDDELDYQVRLPMKLLGDCVISLDTAARQAAERGYGLEAEVRVLLVHGVLHLCGYDHERGEEDLEEMAAAERAIMQQLGWTGQGLISAVGASGATHDVPAPSTSTSGRGFGAAAGAGAAAAKGPSKGFGKEQKGSVLDQAAAAGTAAGGASIRKRPLQSGLGAPAGSGSGSMGVLGNIFGSSSSEGSSKDAPSGKKGVSTAAAVPRTAPSTPAQAPPSSRKTTKAQPAPSAAPPAKSQPQAAAPKPLSATERSALKDRIKLVALDMDGTLLDSRSRIPRSAVQAVKDVLRARKDTRIILATGKARPAAIAAARAAGLEGDHLLVSPATPGVFLQGLAVHGKGGKALSDAALPPDVVARAFQWVGSAFPSGGVSLVAFLGDECATLRMTDDLQALHHTYYEPLARVEASLEGLMAGPPVRKLLFMATPQLVDERLKPRWGSALKGSGASPMQAVPNMLEVVPEGVDKWGGLQLLLSHMGLPPAALMAVGDGGNDLGMVANAGFGVAMGNAVPLVKAAAKAVVRGHDEDGLAEALEMLL